MSRNEEQLPKAYIDPSTDHSSGMSVSSNIYQLHSKTQEECKQTQVNRNVYNTASLQESSLHSTLAKTHSAHPNNCYVVCVSLANSPQVVMPVKAEGNSGARMLSPFSQHHDVRMCPPAFIANLPIRIASPASACNAPTDGMAGPSQDRSKVVAVVSPFKNSTDDYQCDGSELTREPLHNQQSFQNASSVMICQPGNIRQLATPPESCLEMTGKLQSSLQQGHACSVAVSHRFQNASIPHQGSRSSTAQMSSQQLVQQQNSTTLARQPNGSHRDLHLCLGPQQQGAFLHQIQRAQLAQLLGCQQLLGQQRCSQQVLQQKTLPQLTSGVSCIQLPGPLQTDHSLLRAQQSSCQPLPSSDQCLSVRPAVPQQLPALQFSSSQQNANQLMVRQRSPHQSDKNQNLMIQQLLQPHQVRLGVVSTLTASREMSPQIVVHQGASQQLVNQKENSQSLALLLNNFGHLNANVNMIPPQGIAVQHGNCQLTEQRQQRVFQHGSNASQGESNHFFSTTISSKEMQLLSNSKSQLLNAGCMQSDNKQEQFQQQQQQLQQQQQQQMVRSSDAVDRSLLMAVKGDQQKSCDQENINRPSHCVSMFNLTAQNSKNGVIATGSENCLYANHAKVDNVHRGKLPVDGEGAGISSCESLSKRSFPVHTLDQQLHLFSPCLNNSAFRQTLCATSLGHSDINNLRFSISRPGAVTGLHNRFQVPVAKQQGIFAVAGSSPNGNNCRAGKNVITESKELIVNESIRFSSPQPIMGKAFTHLGSTLVAASLSNMAASDRQSSAVVGNRVVSSNSTQNVTPLPGNLVPQSVCLPSTVVHLRMPLSPGNDTRAQVSRASLQNYSSAGMAPFPRNYLRNPVTPVHSNLTSSVTDQNVSCQRLPSALFASPGVGNKPTASSNVKLSPSSGTNDEKMQELPVKHNASAKVFCSTTSSGPNISSASSCELKSPTQQLEIGQECEFQYHTGQRIKAIWDGKYFKVKNPGYSNQDSDQFSADESCRQPSVKGGGMIVKDSQENQSSTESDSGLSSEMVEKSDSSVPETIPLTRPPLHHGTDVLSKSTSCDVTFVSSSLSSVMSSALSTPLTPRRPREEGKFAVCSHCGAFSGDYDHCDQCNHTLPPNVKLYDPKGPKFETPVHSPIAVPVSAKPSTRKQTKRVGDLVLGVKRPVAENVSKLSLKAQRTAVKVSPTLQRPSAKHFRKQEADIVHVLSSDEEDEDPLSTRLLQNVTTHISHKAKKFKGESLSADTQSLEPKRNVTTCHKPNDSCQSFTKTLEPVITANVIHAFFGFIRYKTKSCLILERNMMLLQPVSTTDNSPLTIKASEIRMVAGHINRAKGLNCLFVLISAVKAEAIRKSVKNEDSSVFNPDSSEDCEKYIVLFLDEQRLEFLSTLELIVNQMTVACSTTKPLYKQIDNFDVEKYLQKVCPEEDLRNFIQTSNRSADSFPAGSRTAGNMRKSLENEEEEEDMDCRSRSPSPVHALFSAPIIKLFTYPPTPATGGITVTNEDLFCLNEGEFLNDVIIDFYLKYLATEFLPDEFQRTHVFSSFFYRRLTQKPSRGHTEEGDLECASNQQRRHSRVRTWTRHVDIFEKDFLIVPINERAHWYLAVICYPGLTSPEIGCRNSEELSVDICEINSKKSKSNGKAENLENSENALGGSSRKGRTKAKRPALTKTTAELYIKKMPCILVFDSLACPGRSGAIRILREYLQVEWDVKKKETRGSREFTKETIKGVSPECPQQSNFSDCGVYVLQYVESFFTDPIEDFTFPLKLLDKWFNEDKVKNKRFGLQQLIIDMQKKYNPCLDYNPETGGCVVKCETEEQTCISGTSSHTATV